MDKKDAIEKLKEAGLEDVISVLTADNATEDRLKALEAKLEAAEGKASGILSDKKRAQQKADELQAKIDELEGKDLGETEKLQREVERLNSKLEAEANAKAELETNWKTEKREAQLNKIAGNMKWLDSVPENIRDLTIKNDFSDIDDLGNEVLVADRLKSLSESYAGLLASDAPSGAGSKAGTGSGGASTSLEGLKNKSLSDISKDPKAYLAEAMQAAEQGE